MVYSCTALPWANITTPGLRFTPEPTAQASFATGDDVPFTSATHAWHFITYAGARVRNDLPRGIINLKNMYSNLTIRNICYRDSLASCLFHGNTHDFTILSCLYTVMFLWRLIAAV